MNISELAFKYQENIFIYCCKSDALWRHQLFYLAFPRRPYHCNREAIVTTNFPGMSPQRIELLITKKLEETDS